MQDGSRQEGQGGPGHGERQSGELSSWVPVSERGAEGKEVGGVSGGNCEPRCPQKHSDILTRSRNTRRDVARRTATPSRPSLDPPPTPAFHPAGLVTLPRAGPRRGLWSRWESGSGHIVSKAYAP